MFVAQGNTVGARLAKALGFDPEGITSIVIESAAGEVVRVKVETFLSESQGREVEAICREYVLVERLRPELDDHSKLGDSF